MALTKTQEKALLEISRFGEFGYYWKPATFKKFAEMGLLESRKFGFANRYFLTARGHDVVNQIKGLK